MRFRFVVEVEVNRTEGKFATREELADQLREAIESADPGQLEGENGGQYDVESFDVDEQEIERTPRRKSCGVPFVAAKTTPYAWHPTAPGQRLLWIDGYRCEIRCPETDVRFWFQGMYIDPGKPLYAELLAKLDALEGKSHA